MAETKKSKYCWTVESTKMLISEYESYEMLYNQKHSDYKNRNMRLNVYSKIAQMINTIKDGCTVDDVKKKLNGLRSQYLAEKLKVQNSIKSGANADDIYTPSVYWFPLLKFLDISTTADESESNLDHINSEIPARNVTESDDSISLHDNFEDASASVDNTGPVNPVTLETPRSKRKKICSQESLLLQATKTMTEMSQIAKEKVVTQSQTEKDDELDIFGKFIVSELRSLKNTTNNPYFVRQTKRKLQQVLLNAWDTVDSPTALPGSSTSTNSQESHVPSVPHTVIFDGFSADNNANFGTIQTFDIVADALHTAEVTDNEYHNDNCSKN